MKNNIFKIVPISEFQEGLLNCPFCGNEPNLLYTNKTILSNVNYKIVCSNLQCEATNGEFDTKTATIRAWNTRKKT
jgi:Lar family restriction alleviation protein